MTAGLGRFEPDLKQHFDAAAAAAAALLIEAMGFNSARRGMWGTMPSMRAQPAGAQAGPCAGRPGARSTVASAWQPAGTASLRRFKRKAKAASDSRPARGGPPHIPARRARGCSEFDGLTCPARPSVSSRALRARPSPARGTAAESAHRDLRHDAASPCVVETRAGITFGHRPAWRTYPAFIRVDNLSLLASKTTSTQVLGAERAGRLGSRKSAALVRSRMNSGPSGIPCSV
jgi:hypothetical protein